MFYSKWIHGFVFKLPGDNAFPMFISLYETSDECCRGLQQRWVGGRLDEGVFWKGMREMVCRHKELGIAKGFQGANTQNNVLSCLFGGIDLSIKLIGIK